MTGLADLARSEWGDPAEVYADREEASRLFHPEWHQQAACRGQMTGGHSLWFGTAAERVQARKICNTVCPVKAECDAASAGQHGVWAGHVDPHPTVLSCDVGLAS